ncbi:MAG: hypothetical protein U0165_15285 [Polyangiaceae bacterium]
MKTFRNLFSASLLVALFASSLAACSKDTANEESPTGTQSYDAFLSKLAKATCESSAACCEQTQTTQACTSDVAAILRVSEQFELWPNGMQFDESAAQGCIDAVRKRTDECPRRLDTDEIKTACRKVLVPTVQPGGECDVDSQCVAPSHGKATCVPGPNVCVSYRYLDVGAKCASETTTTGASSESALSSFSSAMCDPDKAYCNGSTGKCEAFAQLGEDCKDRPCADDGASVTCTTNDSGQHLCTALSKKGEACGLGCDGNSMCGDNNGASVCVERKPGGASCGLGFECQSGICDGEGICVGLGTGTTEYLAALACK